jgi:hypothetical protein
MTEQTAIVQRIDTVGAMQYALARYNLLVEFTQKVMKRGKDFGTIPGAGDKPTLLKPGAEKLTSLFELSPEFILVAETVDFEHGLFYFKYRVDMRRLSDGKIVGSGLGSCNSREKKYRYRNIFEWKATNEEKASALKVETKEGKKGPYKVYVVENPDPADLVNTIDKMAQKRALIAATLISCNASEFFTQDIEDMDIIEGAFSEGEPTGQPQSEEKQTGGNGDEYKPEVPSTLQALIDSNVASSVPDAAGIINLSPFRKGQIDIPALVAWGKLYRGWRDTGLDTKSAATKATAGEKPE